MGLTAIPMRAASGPIGGDNTHEFLVLAQTGESEVFYDGRVTATRHTMFTTQLCDNRSVAAWAAGDASQPDTAALGYDPDLLGASGVDPARRPALV